MFVVEVMYKLNENNCPSIVKDLVVFIMLSFMLYVIMGNVLKMPATGLNIFLFGNIYRYKNNTHIKVNRDCIESPGLI